MSVSEMEKKTENMRHLQKEAFQLANYYFVFQGVIFTTIYNIPTTINNNVKCQYHLIPFFLSLIAGTLNLCALTAIAFEYKSALDEIDRIATRMECDAIALKCERHRRLLYIVFCMSLFLGFFVITLIGCFNIPCKVSELMKPTPRNN